MSVWLMLRHFRKRAGVARIVKKCRHSNRHGCYTIALALALHDFGLRVTFHTDPDPAIEPLEARCYEWARKNGILIEPALSLDELKSSIKRQPAIVYLASAEGEGHFSPLIGFRRGQVILPNTKPGELPFKEFERRWFGPGYPRQCVLIGSG